MSLRSVTRRSMRFVKPKAHAWNFAWPSRASRTTRVVVPCFVLMVPISLGQATADLPSPRVGVPIAIIGDSFTAGSAMGGRGSRSWPILVEAGLRDVGIDVAIKTGADGGSGYAKSGSKGTIFADQIPRTVAMTDRLVVVFGSLNDGSIEARSLEQAVDRTFGQVRAAAPDARLLVIGPPWPGGKTPTRVLRARDVVRAQAVSAGAEFVDPVAEGWFNDRLDLIGQDGIHPTDGGHEYLATKIAPLIAAQLSG